MNDIDDLPPRDATNAPFPTHTQWTVLVNLADAGSDTKAREALNRLCEIYWFPIYAFIRRQGNEPDVAKDLTQDFFVHLLEQHLIRQADRSRGRFRTFLLGCLQNFMVDQHRYERAVKRGGRKVFVPLDEADAEERYRQLPAIPPAPTAVYDRTWAATVMAEGLKRFSQVHARRGASARFDVLKGCLTGELSPAGYPVAAASLGMSLEALQTALSRFKDGFAKLVRGVLAETVDRAEINEEIRHLMSAWAVNLNGPP